MTRPALQNKRVVVEQMAFRALKIFGALLETGPLSEFFLPLCGPISRTRPNAQMAEITWEFLSTTTYIQHLFGFLIVLICRSQSRSLIL